ncbi:hypothetical protein PSA7680_03539 [Pseudoruegeria aquimaris]|uniref:LPS-assembly lipoprotein n=1 Tax=Pseudoruegeria aquimaris TaxID=393663 RepID=A0A1Y5TLJ4_9RHOB|nr:LPS assembly lipoprotein LptE [Pseudoruegeria aquimaris]SLN66848.1 hypothetical protein PSA7680_03539 [Pseudoruegeria aquimaris]
MSSFDRRTLLISLAGLAACGFEPAYGPGGSAANLRGSILVDDPTERFSFELVKQLETRLGQPVNPRYGLSIDLRLRDDDLAITQEQEILRYNVIGEADFAIRDLASGEELFRGKASSFTAYAATGTTVSTREAQKDAYDRLMVILADQITSRLIASSGSWLT